MPFDHTTEAFIRDFVTDLRENNVAIFAGAGMSKGSGFVDWPTLLTGVAQELGLSVDKEHDLISLAQYHVNHRGNRSGIKRAILEEFSHQAQLSATHRILARLPIQTYWTTNYDSLIEDSLKAALKVPDVKSDPKNLSNTRPRRDAIVYKMHGDVTNSDEAIITKEQYETYYRTHEAFITALSGDLIAKTFLFIGFSFTDPNLDYVLSRLRHQSGDRQHYCFMKKESKGANDDNDTFKYKQRKQELRVADLKRYKIAALLIDDYEDIVKILTEIENRYKKRTIFVSGSAEEYGKWDRLEAQKFIHKLSKAIIQAGSTIVNGFGWGVGSAVINGALEAVYENYERCSDDQLIMRPFPQFETGGKSLPDMWQEYREKMISLAGVAIFIFGNKLGNDGAVESAGGVKKEFEIAQRQGLVLIPIAATGYMARELFELVENNPDDYYQGMGWIVPKIKELADPSKSPDDLIKLVVEIVKVFNK
ncbi:SIR2 family protein [Cupriavidus pauculus]|uniref:SIR2 family protein n=1 Tax=Cupriavidus pauculus TaxID=82633 RepID=UPI00385739B8